MTESEPQRGPLARKDRAEKTALFRYQLIREAADTSLTSRQRGPMVRALAAAGHTGPSGQSVRYSRETLDRWISAWQREGFDGLKPRERAADPVLHDEFLKIQLAADVTDFHTYSADWTPDGVTFYFDDQFVAKVEQSPNYPMQLMLNVYEFQGKSTSPYPKKFLVNWVRGYRHADTAAERT